MLIAKIAATEAPKTRRLGQLMLRRGKRNMPVQRKMQLPARKELQINAAEQPGRNRVLSSTKCSDYEPIDYCSPLYP